MSCIKPCKVCGEGEYDVFIPSGEIICGDCNHDRMVENAPDNCGYCDESPVGYIDEDYLCPRHAAKEHQGHVTYFVDYDHDEWMNDYERRQFEASPQTTFGEFEGDSR